MDVKIYKNFLLTDECKLLSNVALNNIPNWFGDGITHGNIPVKHRLTTRMYMGEKKYTSEILDIANRARQRAGVDTYPLIANHGSNGIVCSITYQGGNVYAHKDPRSELGLPTYRCNVLTQANDDGAELYVNGKKIDIEIGDLHCYMVSELEHYVTEAKGVTPRIMWLFGAHIPKEHWRDYGLS
jgi:hypothetical protein